MEFKNAGTAANPEWQESSRAVHAGMDTVSEVSNSFLAADSDRWGSGRHLTCGQRILVDHNSEQ
ncbi:hypothetical protein SAMN05428948_1266 [Massilia sp. CF038]|nr:hypothetical protein SAMN05428948_1266 [Massilia sp. CF038]